MANDVADDLKQAVKDTLTGKSIMDTLSSRAKALLKKSPPPEAPPTPDSYHDEQVRQANESFRKQTTGGGSDSPIPKPIAKYKDGTDYVPETGPAILHKGEAVLKKEDAEKYRRHMASPSKSLGGKKRGRPKGSTKKKKAPRHMHIELADNGGFHVRHQHDAPLDGSGESATPETTHSLGDPSALLGHIQDTYGGQMPGAGAAGPGAPAPPQGM